MKVRKASIQSIAAYLFSPLLSIPIILVMIYRKNKTAIWTLVLILATISFLYIPHVSNDKARYFSRYVAFRSFTLKALFNYLFASKRPDFIFDILIFLFSKLRINFQFFFFTNTLVTTGIIFFLFNKLWSHGIIRKGFFGAFLLVLFSLSLPTLFSGVRFYLGAAVFLLAIYHLFYTKKKTLAIFIFAFSILTHFSLAFFLPALILLYFFPKINYKVIFLLSAVFIFIPGDFLSGFLGLFTLPDSYSEKVNAYLRDPMMRERIRNIGGSAALLNKIRNLWILFSYIYILFGRKNIPTSTILKIFFVFSSFTFITYSNPIIFSRFSVLIRQLFAFVVIHDYILTGNIKRINWFLVLFSLLFVIDVYILRNNFTASLFQMENISSVTLFMNGMSPSDFLK